MYDRFNLTITWKRSLRSVMATTAAPLRNVGYHFQAIKPLGARLLALRRCKATWGMALPRNKSTSVMATTPAPLRNVGYRFQELKPLGARQLPLPSSKATWGMALPRNKHTTLMATTPAPLT